MSEQITAGRDAAVERLLHDVGRKKGGAELARMMGDGKSAAQLDEERSKLLAEAEALDPAHECYAWKVEDV